MRLEILDVEHGFCAYAIGGRQALGRSGQAHRERRGLPPVVSKGQQAKRREVGGEVKEPGGP